METVPSPAPAASGGATVAPDGPAATADSGLTEDVLYRLLVAEMAGQRGRVDLALDNYLALAHALDDPQIAERATRIAVFARDSARALEAAERWVELEPDSLDGRQIIAAMKIRAGDVDGALAHLQYILDASGDAAGTKLRMIANFLGREQDQETALEVMRRLIEARNGDIEALTAYALLAIRTEHQSEAEDAMNRIVAAGPPNVGVAMAYLGLLQKHDRVADAIEWLQQVLARQSDQFELRLVYARFLADAKRYDESRVQFEKLAAEAPDNGDVHYALGLLYLQSNQLDAARERFQALVGRDQRVEESVYYLGQIAEAQKDASAALDWYRRLEGGPNLFEAQLRIALILARQGDLEGARNHLHALSPASPEEQMRRIRVEGEILSEQGRLEEAMAVYDAALEGDKYDTELLYTRAMLAERMDRLDIVERDLRVILEHEPDNAQALNALGYTLADRTDRYDEAYALISRAHELSPDDFFILDSMGWVLYRLGRLPDAADYLRRARALRDDPEVAAHLAEVLWILGDRQGARDVWESALRTTPGDETLLDTIKRLTP
ncbi:MAG: tetratricopeptide repeat protein [Gammaproteobacteria bacterium]|nr:tetratricopeptide repeat protein [Gammaproteobacteria bacterium]